MAKKAKGKTLNDVVMEQRANNDVLTRLDRNIDNFITLWASNKMDEAENMRERISGKDDSSVQPEVPTVKNTEGLNFGFAALVAGIAGSIAGFTLGLGDTLNAILKKMNFDVGARLTKWSNSFKAIFSANGKVGAILTKIGSSFKPMTDFFGRLNSFIGTKGVIGKTFAKITSFFEPVTRFISKFGASFSKVFGFFRIIGRAFLPITLAIETGMAIFEELTSLGDGSDLFAKFTAVAKGVLKGIGSLVTLPLDLLKDGISWLSSKLGFDNFSKLLDGFSMADSFGSIVDTILNFVEGVGRGATAAIKAIFTKGDSPIEAFMREFDNGFNDNSGKGEKPPIPQPTFSASTMADIASITGVNESEKYGDLSRWKAEQRTDAQERVEFVTKTVTAEMIKGDESRQSVSEEIGRQTSSASGDANVTIVQTTQVSAPTTTQNNVSNTSSPFVMTSPTTNNGTRSNAYSW